MPKFIDLTGKKFTRLTVVKRSANNAKNLTQWLCRCTCGTELTVLGASLASKNTKSCGCYNADRIRTRKGLSLEPEYEHWSNMVDRCSGKNSVYWRYKGVKLHKAWLSDYLAFKEHIGPRPSITHTVDRINNALGYIPGNVRWATKTEQVLNRSCTVMVDYGGQEQPLAALARAYGLEPKVVYKRVKGYNWDVEKALKTPLTYRPKRKELSA